MNWSIDMHRARLGVLLLALASCPLVAAGADEAMLQRIQRLETALNNKGLLDLVRQVELLQAEVRQLRGELENQIFALEQQRKSQRTAYVDLEQRIGSLEQGGALPAAAPAQIALADVTPEEAVIEPPLPTLAAAGDNRIAGAPAEQAIALAPAPAPAMPGLPANDGTAGIVADVDVVAPALLPATPSVVVVDAARAIAPQAGPTIDSAASEAAYRDAFGLLKAGQYDDSIAAFDTYLQQYPASQYADNAQYWLGEAYYVKRQFEPAIEQYRKLIENYPASKKQSHALLKMAYSYDELGLTPEAVSVLNTLKTRFPGSAAARLADERLQRMRAAAP